MDDAAAIRLLHEMVRIPSVSGDEGRLAAFLVGELHAAGLDAHVDPAGNLVGSAGSGPVHVVLCGHLDTVPGDLPVRLEDGVLHGRGSVDAKGPLAAFVAAATRHAARGGAGLRVTVVGCVEEEVASSAGARALLDWPAPDALVIGEPSGWDGVTLGYKGCLRATLRIDGELAHGAHDVQTVPERLCASWERIRAALSSYEARSPRLFDQLAPSLIGIESGHDGRFASGALHLDVRLPPALGPHDALAWLQSAASDGLWSLAAPGIPAWSGPRTTPLHNAFARAIRTAGGRARYKLKTGTADLNLLAPAWGCPALAYGPGDAALDHTPHEHQVLDEYLTSVRVLQDVLATWQARA